MTDHQGHILLSPEAKVVLLPKAGHHFFGPSQQIESSSAFHSHETLRVEITETHTAGVARSGVGVGGVGNSV